MRSRIITAAVALPLLLVTLIVLPPWVTAVLLAAANALAAWELLWETGLVKHLRLVAYSALLAAGVGVWCYFGNPYAWGIAGAVVFCALMFGEMLISKGKLPFEKVLICVAGGFLIPYFVSALMRIRNMELGNVYVLLPFALAFMSDSCAYFAGRFLGRHKLAPTISPKKTVEGMFGGIAGAILGAVIFGLVLALGFQLKVNFLLAIVYGVLGSLASVIGDLAFSVIKRQTGIKDFGKIFPGHGGILDRLDSLCIVSPLTEALLIILPIAEKLNG